MAPKLRKPSNVWQFFAKNSTGGKCKIFNRDVRAGGSGGNTTNLKNHLLWQHSKNPLVKKKARTYSVTRVKNEVRFVA